MPDLEGMKAFGVTRPVLGPVVAGVATLALLGTASTASATRSELRPVSDHLAGWTPVQADALFSAIDEEVTAGQTPTSDLIKPRTSSRVTILELDQPTVPEGEVPSALTGYFFGKTGHRTRLEVQLRSAGTIVSRTTLQPNSPAKWYQLSTPNPERADLGRLQLVFRASRMRRAEVRAAYAKVITKAPGEEPPDEPGGADVSVFGSTTTIRPDQATPSGGRNAAALVAAQNEFESFQVVVEATDGPIDGLDMELTGALDGPGPAQIDTSDVTIYREEYYEVSAADGKPRSSRKGGEGLWPDALIPEVDPYYGEDRAAFPIDIDSGEKEIAWIDVFIPADTPAGIYQGILRISDANGELARVPVKTRVSSFEMPSTSSLKSAFLMTPPGYFPCRAHRETDWCYPEDERNWKLDYLYARAALENRMTIPNAMPGPYQQAPTSEHFEEYMLPLIKGTDNGGIDGTAAPRLQGAELTTITAMWQCIAEEGCLRDWREIAQEHDFEDKFFAYVCDEPFDETRPENWDDWRDCSRNARLAEQVWPGVQTQVTSTIQNANNAQGDGKIDVDRDIDILTAPINYLANRTGNPQAGNQRPAYNSFVNNNDDGQNEVWGYTYCAQFSCDELEAPYFDGWPAYVIDQPASQARAMGWMAYRYDLSGELYFNTTLALGTAYQDQYEWGGNGDGTLFYPGSPSGFRGAPAIGGQHDIPIESIRMKRIREGREDYELLHALDAQGLGSQAMSALTGLVGPADSAMFSTDVSQQEIDATRCTLMVALDPSVAPECA
jgi:hypothetical protein